MLFAAWRRATQTLALGGALLLSAHTHTHASTPGTASSVDMAPRVAACVTCHGRDGQSTSAGYFPRIAGKPAGYLYEQLRNFRDGRRAQPAMQHLLRNLTDDYLYDMAVYFAQLRYPYPAPSPSDLSAAQLAHGQQLVLHGDPTRQLPACISCHGPALTGVEPGIPGLLGLPRLYIAAQLGAWVTHERRALAPDCMAQVGQRLQPADIQAIAGWLAAQPMPASSAAVAQLAQPLPQPCSVQMPPQMSTKKERP